MIALLLYGAVSLIVFSAILTRLGLRRAAASRRAMEAEERTLATIGTEVEEITRALYDAQDRVNGLDTRLGEAQAALQAAERQLAAARTMPAERYYVFDRLDPRPGTIWEVPITHGGEANHAHRMAAVWGGTRRYLVVAGTRREAMDRLTQRYPKSYGFEVGGPVPCALFLPKPSGDGPVPLPPAEPGPAVPRAARMPKPDARMGNHEGTEGADPPASDTPPPDESRPHA